MKSEFNNCYLVGNVGREPEVKNTAAGNSLSMFNIGCYQGKEKQTMWLKVKTLSALPDVGRGDKVGVTGRLYFEEFKKRDGTMGTEWGIFADKVEVLKKKEEAAF